MNKWHLQRLVFDIDHPVHDLFSLKEVDKLEKSIVLGLQKQDIAKEKDNVVMENKVLLRLVIGTVL